MKNKNVFTIFSNKLKKLRKARRWTQDELGKKVGVHGRHIGKYELGKVLPNTDSLIKIAEIFDVSIDYLVRDVEHFEFKDKSLQEQFAAVEKMAVKDKEVIILLIDAFVKKKQVEKIMD